MQVWDLLTQQDYTSQVTIAANWGLPPNRFQVVKTGDVVAISFQALYNSAIPQDSTVKVLTLPSALRPSQQRDVSAIFIDAGSRIGSGLFEVHTDGDVYVKGPYDANTGWRWLSCAVMYVV